jgi:hypothetical protein
LRHQQFASASFVIAVALAVASQIAVAFVASPAVLASASFVIAVALAVASSEIAVAVCDSGSVLRHQQFLHQLHLL